MGLFGFGKKKAQPVAQAAPAAAPAADDGQTVKILGGGCAKCNQLEAATRAAMAQLGMHNAIVHITDFTEIATYGVMTTPALVVGNKVLSYGKVLKTEEIVALMTAK